MTSPELIRFDAVAQCPDRWLHMLRRTVDEFAVMEDRAKALWTVKNAIDANEGTEFADFWRSVWSLLRVYND